jgi:hypothetical protein
MISLRRKYAFLFSQTGQDVSAFLHQNNNKLLLFIHKLIVLYEQASSHTSFLKKTTQAVKTTPHIS